ncbi:hypothetical protein A3761_20750 [Oleiphilus sp. HI0123]|nr:hypothetical protein A3761_20750 [Oleiphilus sp. HI0123]
MLLPFIKLPIKGIVKNMANRVILEWFAYRIGTKFLVNNIKFKIKNKDDKNRDNGGINMDFVILD